MAQASSAVKFEVGDIVFGQKYGFLPWPGRLIDTSDSQSGLVQFMYTLDRHKIPYAKIWPYNEEYKQKFITKNTLEYEDFNAAIYITESILKTEFVLPTPNEEELRFLLEVRAQSDTLTVEPLFIAEINKLRCSLTKQQQNFAIAGEAFEKLLELPVSQLLLIRSPEAVESIRLLCRFGTLNIENLADAELVREQAEKLMKRFADVFPQPFSELDFWSEYCCYSELYMRYTKPKP